MVPDKGSKHPALIYLHPEGKSAGAAVGGEIEGFVKQGYIVLSPDLSGSGELGSVSDYVAFLGVQIGRSIAGIRAGDIMRCVQYLKSRSDVEADQLVAVARGSMTIPLVHAAAFDTSIKRVALVEPLISLRSVVMNRFYHVSFSDMVTNALRAYDLPDLAASIAPRKLMLINVQDQVSARTDRASLEKEMTVVRSAYAQAGSTSNLIIRNWEPFQLMSDLFAGWLR
jgi:cephalosporin-C deacetylase-like acetyl esterase